MTLDFTTNEWVHVLDALQADLDAYRTSVDDGKALDEREKRWCIEMGQIVKRIHEALPRGYNYD